METFSSSQSSCSRQSSTSGSGTATASNPRANRATAGRCSSTSSVTSFSVTRRTVSTRNAIRRPIRVSAKSIRRRSRSRLRCWTYPSRPSRCSAEEIVVRGRDSSWLSARNDVHSACSRATSTRPANRLMPPSRWNSRKSMDNAPCAAWASASVRRGGVGRGRRGGRGRSLSRERSGLSGGSIAVMCARVLPVVVPPPRRSDEFVGSGCGWHRTWCAAGLHSPFARAYAARLARPLGTARFRPIRTPLLPSPDGPIQCGSGPLGVSPSGSVGT